MTKAKWVIVLLFLVAFAAGVCSTLVGGQLTRSAAPKYASRLGAALELTPAQQEQTDKIWADWRKDWAQKERDQRHALQKQRDDAIRQLVPVGQQAELDRIREGYKHQTTELDEQRRQAFEAAVTAKIKALLTPAQQKKYEQILAEGHAENRRGGAATREAGGTGNPGSTPGAAPAPAPGADAPVKP